MNNIRYALDKVQPFGPDLCSGIRINGKLGGEKLDAFMRAVSE